MSRGNNTRDERKSFMKPGSFSAKLMVIMFGIVGALSAVMGDYFSAWCVVYILASIWREEGAKALICAQEDYIQVLEGFATYLVPRTGNNLKGPVELAPFSRR